LLKVKLQSPAVASKPFPVTVPVPSSERDFLLRAKIEDDVKSKVKPPTLQSTKDEGEDPKNHGVDMVTSLFGVANVAKVPLSLSTWGSVHPVMSEAFIKERLSNVADPLMLRSPLIGMASASEAKAKRRKMPPTDKEDRSCRCAR
jgi:hypothetical protein